MGWGWGKVIHGNTQEQSCMLKIKPTRVSLFMAVVAAAMVTIVHTKARRQTVYVKQEEKKGGGGGGERGGSVAAVCVPVQKWPVRLRAGCGSARSPDKSRSRSAVVQTVSPLTRRQPIRLLRDCVCVCVCVCVNL